MSREQYNELLELSAEIGSDPALVQAAGGNTSIKQDGTLWIKASGTWLMNALAQNIMVPVALAPLLQALQNKDPGAEKAQSFVLDDQNPANLRPSIETTVHAVFPQTIVVHVHCVETIAVAARADAQDILNQQLDGFNWRYVSYAKPGLTLSKAISESLYRDNMPADVVVLGNHGLVVAADTVEEVSILLAKVCTAIKQPVRRAPAVNMAALQQLTINSDYEFPLHVESHAVATDYIARHIAGGGSLYPDHVIFLGEGSVIAADNETPAQVVKRYSDQKLPPPVSILFPGYGVLMRKGGGDSAHAMARCLADVTARIPETADINYLTKPQNEELLNWDAEKYRQALNENSSDKHKADADA